MDDVMWQVFEYKSKNRSVFVTTDMENAQKP